MISPPSPTGPSACPDEEALAACVEGTLGAERARALEVHVDACASCYQLLTTYARAYGSRDEEKAGGGSSVSHGRIVEGLQRSSALAPGTMVGRYVVEQWIGEGAAGVVYAAHDPELDRRVALKLLQSTVDSEGVRSKLLREARAMAKLAHPHVVGVYDAGSFGEHVFLAMEFVDGATLRTWVRDAAPGKREILSAFLDAGRGLAAAHAVGLVHRDFKPENVLRTKDGQAKVGDFGLAFPTDAGRANAESPRLVGGIPGGAPAQNRSRSVSSVAGTPAYMAPEQALGRTPDARSDQFSFCVALYEALSGAHPFGVGSDEPRGTSRSRTLSPRGVPSRIQPVVDRGLRLSPDERYPSMDGLLDDLANAAAPPSRRVLQAAALLVMLVGVGAIYARASSTPSLAPVAQAAVLAPGAGSGAQTEPAFAAPLPVAVEQPIAPPAARATDTAAAPLPVRPSNPPAPRRAGKAPSAPVDPASYQ